MACSLFGSGRFASERQQAVDQRRVSRKLSFSRIRTCSCAAARSPERRNRSATSMSPASTSWSDKSRACRRERAHGRAVRAARDAQRHAASIPSRTAGSTRMPSSFGSTMRSPAKGSQALGTEKAPPGARRGTAAVHKWENVRRAPVGRGRQRAAARTRGPSRPPLRARRRRAAVADVPAPRLARHLTRPALHKWLTLNISTRPREPRA